MASAASGGGKPNTNRSSNDDSSSSSSSEDDNDDDSEEDLHESKYNLREKLRSNSTNIERIRPSIEELEESENLDLAELQKLIMRDKELDSVGKGFEDHEEDDEDGEMDDYEDD